MSLTSLLVIAAALAAPPDVAVEPAIAQYLYDGRLAEAESALRDRISQPSESPQDQFCLGIVQSLRAVERLGQAAYRHGIEPPHFAIFLGIPQLAIPKNPDPEALTYAQTRLILADLAADLRLADATLSQVDLGDRKVVLDVARIQLDLIGDGTGMRNLPDILRPLLQLGAAQLRSDRLVFAFDAADVVWLRGYCNLALGLVEVWLAHDYSATFDHAGHLLASRADTPFEFLREEERSGSPWGKDLLDVVAGAHTIRWPVIAPERMRAALAHFEAVIGFSRTMCRLVRAEKDDDREWIPGPKQRSALGLTIPADLLNSWERMLDEVEALLAGRKLVPLWRGQQPRGWNLRRVFTEPRDFDLVLWIQGTAAAPYLEDGPMTDENTWRTLSQLLGGRWWGFAVWMN